MVQNRIISSTKSQQGEGKKNRAFDELKRGGEQRKSRLHLCRRLWRGGGRRHVGLRRLRWGRGSGELHAKIRQVEELARRPGCELQRGGKDLLPPIVTGRGRCPATGRPSQRAGSDPQPRVYRQVGPARRHVTGSSLSPLRVRCTNTGWSYREKPYKAVCVGPVVGLGPHVGESECGLARLWGYRKIMEDGYAFSLYRSVQKII
jgi:hypothetical protein